jgi:carbamoyl-phosphate synthase large subunit
MGKMKKYNVLVTGVGAVIGYGIIRSLRKSSYDVRVVGTDIHSDAVGGYWCDEFEQAVPAASGEYPEHLKRMIRKNRIDLVIPGIEQDIARINRDRHEFSRLETKFVINDSRLIEVSQDKWEMNAVLEKEGWKTIKSRIDGSFDEVSKFLGVPMLLKLRRSYASKGMQIIENEDDYAYWKKKTGSNFMVQEIIGSDEQEYTISAFGYGDGKCSRKICFQRRLSGEGSTVKANFVEIEALNRQVDELTRIFEPVGPTNYQFRLHHDGFMLLEINPRISSATSLRTAMGYNEAEMCVDFFLEHRRPDVACIKKGRAIRFIEDFCLYDDDI